MHINTIAKKFPYLVGNPVFRLYPGNKISFHPHPQETIFLSESAWLVYSLCNGMNTGLTIYETLIEKYELDQSDLFAFLVEASEKGFLTFSNELSYKEIKVFGSNEYQYPTFLSIMLTDKCNLNCSYCYGDYSIKNSSFLDYSKLIETFENFIPNAISSVELTGGEPLLHKNFVNIYEYLLKKLDFVTILSNGVLFNDGIYDIIRKNIQRTSVQISIDGCSEKTNEIVRGVKNSWSKTLTTLKSLLELKAAVRVVYMLTNENRHELLETCSLMKSIGIQNLMVSIPHSIGRGSEIKHPDNCSLVNFSSKYSSELIGYIDQALKYYGDIILTPEKLKANSNGIVQTGNCGAGWRMATVNPNGDILACPIVGLGSKMGNIFKEDLLEIFNSPKNSFYRTFNKIEDISCQDCKFNLLCGQCLSNIFLANQKRLEIGFDYCSIVKQSNINNTMNFEHKVDFNF